MVADFIPVDTCIAMLVAVAWRTATRPSNPITVVTPADQGTLCPGVQLYQRSHQPHHLEPAKTRGPGQLPVSSLLHTQCIISPVRRYPFDKVYRYPYANYRENYLANRVAQVC